MTDSEGVLLPHGGYEKLRGYQVAEAVYDATVVLCDRFIDKHSRTHDQMVQAARSGGRNISEGNGAAATSRKSEMLLTNVARASLSDELIKDFKSFLFQRGLRVWHKDSPEARNIRERLKQDMGLAGLADFVAKATPEQAANAMLCAINQAAYLLRRQLESQSQTFIAEGGFTEKLYAERIKARGVEPAKKSDPSDKSDQTCTPTCPLCGKTMRRRIARQGAHAGTPFWGCSGYPDCRGTRPLPDNSVEGATI